MLGVVLFHADGEGTRACMSPMLTNRGTAHMEILMASARGNSDPARKKTCGKEKDAYDFEDVPFQYVPFTLQKRSIVDSQ